MKRIGILTIIRIFCSCALVLTMSSNASAQPKVTKVTVFQAIQTLLYTTYYVAIDKGFFTKHGLDVTTVTAGNASNAVAALISGSATFCITDPMTIGIARHKGAPIKVVSAAVTGVPVWIVVPPNSPIKTIKDLEGKTVTSGVKPTTDTYLFEDLMKKNHIKVNENLIALGGEPAALFAGKSDAAVVYSPQVDEVTAQGGRIIYSFTNTVKSGWAFSGVGAREETIEKQPAVVQAFTDALADAMQYMRQHPEGAEEVGVKQFPTLPAPLVRAAVKRMITEHVYPTSPVLTKAMFDNALRLQVSVGTIKPGTVTYNDLLDMKFARAAAGQIASK